MGYEKPKNHLVAVQYGSGETVLNVIKCIYVNEATYRSLLNKKFDYDQKEIEKKLKIQEEINTLKEEINKLKEEIKVLKGE